MRTQLLGAAVLCTVSAQANAYDLIDLGAHVEPKAINNATEVVGAGGTDAFPSAAFLWAPAAGLTTLNGLSANAINDDGKIAGNTQTGAFILDGGRYSQLIQEEALHLLMFLMFQNCGKAI